MFKQKLLAISLAAMTTTGAGIAIVSQGDIESNSIGSAFVQEMEMNPMLSADPNIISKQVQHGHEKMYVGDNSAYVDIIATGPPKMDGYPIMGDGDPPREGINSSSMDNKPTQNFGLVIKK